MILRFWVPVAVFALLVVLVVRGIDSTAAKVVVIAAAVVVVAVGAGREIRNARR